MYALSTAGSIIGTFLPVAVLIPAIGTRRTMLATACLLALAASPVLGRRYLAVPALIGAVALVPPGAVKPGSPSSTRASPPTSSSRCSRSRAAGASFT